MSLRSSSNSLARPRHDPLTLLAAVAAAVDDVDIGTAVLLPALRNPVVLAHQLATIDQISNGRLIVGAGIAADLPTVRAEFAAAGVPFDGRVGRMMESFRLMKALWSGQPVDWDGRWQLEQGVLAPTPAREGGPPVWIGTGAQPGIERAARHFNGWFPIGPDPETFAARRKLFAETARAAGRSADELTTALYLTIAIDEDARRADAAINTYLQDYYGAPPAAMRKIQACFGGPLRDVLGFIRGYVEAGAQHLVVRVVGGHQHVLTQLSAHRDELS